MHDFRSLTDEDITTKLAEARRRLNIILKIGYDASMMYEYIDQLEFEQQERSIYRMSERELVTGETWNTKDGSLIDQKLQLKKES